MQRKVIISCAVTGSADTPGRNPAVPVTPEQIARSSIDAAKVERILENLLSNALRHTPSDAHIWLRARGQEGGVLIVVEDDGPGVPRDLYEAVFEPFRRGNGNAQGAGLGLAIARGFAEANGARVWAEDNGGGHFVLALPA